MAISPQLVMGIPTYSAEDPEHWDGVVTAAEVLDRAGVDRLVVSDHVVFGERMDQYARPEQGGRAGGQQPTGPDGSWLEPLTTLALLAGRTSRVRLGTNILIAALRRPVVLAKMATTIDVLSGGRLDLGVGVSWQEEEYAAAGLDFRTRGRLLDETLEVCQALWRDNPSSFSSDRLDYEDIHMMPKPRQPGGVPIWVSGSVNKAVVRRLARFGTGWITWALAPEDVPAAVAQMRVALADVGRDPTDLRVLAELSAVEGDPAGTVAPVEAWAAAGVTDFRVVWPELTDSEVGKVVAAFRAAAGRDT